MNEGNADHENSPRIADDDTVEKRETKPPPISNSPAGLLIRDYLKISNALGDDAQDLYTQIVDELRKNAGVVLAELSRSLGCADENDYPLRWALVHAAAELNHSDALSLLRNVAMTPIPPEKSSDPHSFSTVAEETIIRTTATDAIAVLARQGLEAAEEALFEVLVQPSISIRRSAIHGLLSYGGAGSRRERIIQCLPKEHHYLLQLKAIRSPLDVAQVPDPRHHLRDPARGEKMPAPGLPAEQERRANDREHPPETQSE